MKKRLLVTAIILCSNIAFAEEINDDKPEDAPTNGNFKEVSDMTAINATQIETLLISVTDNSASLETLLDSEASSSYAHTLINENGDTILEVIEIGYRSLLVTNGTAVFHVDDEGIVNPSYRANMLVEQYLDAECTLPYIEMAGFPLTSIGEQILALSKDGLNLLGLTAESEKVIDGTVIYQEVDRDANNKPITAKCQAYEIYTRSAKGVSGYSIFPIDTPENFTIDLLDDEGVFAPKAKFDQELSLQ